MLCWNGHLTQEIPPPGSYEVQNSFERTQGVYMDAHTYTIYTCVCMCVCVCMHACVCVCVCVCCVCVCGSSLTPNCMIGKVEIQKGAGKGAFLSSTKRTVPPHDVLIEQPDKLNPGKKGPFNYIHLHSELNSYRAWRIYPWAVCIIWQAKPAVF